MAPARIEPTAEEVDEWAGREQKRRKAWLAGPSEEEKRAWARRHSYVTSEGSIDQPPEDEVDEWATREATRRRRWPDGPTPEERDDWARARRTPPRSRGTRSPRYSQYDDDFEDYLLRRTRYEDYLARAGAWDLLLNWPQRLRASLIRSGLDAEYDYYTGPSHSRRIPYDYY